MQAAAPYPRSWATTECRMSRRWNAGRAGMAYDRQKSMHACNIGTCNTLDIDYLLHHFVLLSCCNGVVALSRCPEFLVACTSKLMFKSGFVQICINDQVVHGV
jgi:hypothetical protein